MSYINMVHIIDKLRPYWSKTSNLSILTLDAIINNTEPEIQHYLNVTILARDYLLPRLSNRNELIYKEIFDSYFYKCFRITILHDGKPLKSQRGGPVQGVYLTLFAGPMPMISDFPKIKETSKIFHFIRNFPGVVYQENPASSTSGFRLLIHNHKQSLFPQKDGVTIPTYSLTNIAVKAAIPTYSLTNIAVKAAIPTYSLTNIAVKAAIPTHSLTNIAVKAAIPTYSLTNIAVKAAIPTYSLTNIAVKAARTYRVGEPSGRCVADTGPYYNCDLYSLDLCQAICLQKVTQKSCNCTDISLPWEKDYNIMDDGICFNFEKLVDKYCQQTVRDEMFSPATKCSEDDITKIKQSMHAASKCMTRAADLSSDYFREDCGCHPPCEDIKYETKEEKTFLSPQVSEAIQQLYMLKLEREPVLQRLLRRRLAEGKSIDNFKMWFLY